MILSIVSVICSIQPGNHASLKNTNLKSQNQIEVKSYVNFILIL